MTDKIQSRLRFVAVFCLQFAAIAEPAQTQLLRGHVPGALANLKAVGRLAAARELTLAIALPLRNREGLTNLLQRIYDPANPEFRHFLTPAQFAESFGPTEDDYRAVTAFAKANGLKVTGTYPNRTLLDVAGSVSDIEKTFHVTMRTYRHPLENRVFYAPDTEPSLELATPVLHIAGLDDYLQTRPMNLRSAPQSGFSDVVTGSGSGPGGTYVGEDFRAAYVPGVPLTGAGQTVGLVEFDGYYAGDISDYASIAAVPAVPLTNVYLDGFSGTPGQNNREVALDIDMAVSMAPGLSSVLVYEGKLADDILNRMATDALARQLSGSWTYATDSETEQIFQQFAAQGQSFFNAAGDSDAWIGQIPSPCDDPNITSVGGTTLTTSGPQGAWVAETVWNWGIEIGANFDGQGTGGGISTIYTIPPWQLGVSMNANQGSTTYRNIPDVAMVADNVFVVADNGQGQNLGGTSCGAPLWAAFVALANEQAAATGRPPLGFINPAIYALGQSVNYTNCFHDVSTGNNTWSESPALFYAVPGYDLCSGWGAPLGSNLISLLALNSLQISPPGGWASSGMVGGPLMPAAQAYTMTNAGNMPLNWAAAATVPWLTVLPSAGALVPGGATAAVVASLNAAADGLFAGTYGATIWFTNLTDGTVQSRPFSLTIIKPPVITAQPASLAVIGGSMAIFSAETAGGLPLYCQWQRNGINVADNGRLSGSQSTLTQAGKIYGSGVSTLTISNVADADAGTYALVASNAAGVAVSSSVVLTVVPSEPVIIAQPASQTVLVGTTVQLSAAAEGNAPFSYQWQQNGTNLTDSGGVSGSLTPTLTINGASSANIGTFSVVVSNALGTTASTGAVLTVQVAVPGAQLARNGGFETGDLSSWTDSTNFAGASVKTTSTAVHSGRYGALLGGTNSLGVLSQVIPTVPGQFYQLSLWLNSPDGVSPNEFIVAWNGTTMFDQTNLGAIDWTNLQFFVLATDTNTLLQFEFLDEQSFLGLDDIQVFPLTGAGGPPIIAAQPASQISVQGGGATFSALSSGDLPLLYQWQFDGANLDDATNATLVLTNLTGLEAGTYDVLVSNAVGWTTSSNAMLSVLTGGQELITFDDLPYRLVPVPPGYGNLNWSNFYYLNGVVGRTSGYGAGMVSIPKVAYNGSGTPASLSASAPFALYSAYLTGAWDDDLVVEAQGYNGATLIYDQTCTLSATTPTLVTFNFVGVTSVQFIPSGGVHHRGYSGSGTQFVIDNVSAFVTPIPPSPPPISMSVLYSFGGLDGARPCSELVQGADGNFYGTTEYGGTNGDGAVFRMTTNGALSTLVSFNGSNANPVGALAQGADGNFYGTTEYGGTNDYGTVFRMTTNGALSTLASFNHNATGGNPIAALVQGPDGTLYGITESGGMFGEGTVFSVTTNGALTTLVSFDATNGANPHAAPILGGDGNFYGTTLLGGTYGTGTVFKMTTNGVLTTVLSLNGFNAYPYGGLAQGADGNLYGTTYSGGSNGFGTVFRLTTNGMLSTLASFDYYTSGENPYATLVQGADGNFYGTTSSGGSFGTTYFGGTYGGGTVFSVTTNGTLTTLLSFENTNGLYPQAALAQGSDGYFYGTAPYGGVGFNGYYNSGNGVVFRLGPAPVTTAPEIVAQPAAQTVPAGGTAIFSVSAGGAPPLNYSWHRNGSPIAGASQSAYITNNVQQTDSGDIFSCMVSNAYGSVTSSNTVLAVLVASGAMFKFNGADGGYPSSALIQGADGNFYGTTQYGGAYGNGTVFRMTTNGLQSILASLNFYVTGANPLAALLQAADGNFYGTTTYGGIHDGGTVFRMTSNGALTVLVAFNGSDGANPIAPLVQGADGNFYGTTFSGGTYNYGTVFRMTSNGTQTTLFSFDYLNGAYPQGALVQGADGSFYGTASSAGPNYDGTVFRMTTNGAVTTLLSFDGSNGAYPQSALVAGADGTLYGTATQGGTNGYGTLFGITTNGMVNRLFLFNGSNGAAPQGGLVQGADGNFYGATTSGGAYGDGTLFRMTTNGAVTGLFSFNGTNGSFPAALIQATDGSFYGTAAYGGLGYSGLYWSGNGAVFRLSGVFTPEPPSIGAQPASQTVHAGGSAAFSVTAAGSIPLTYSWQRNGTNIDGANGSAYVANDVQPADSGSVFSCLVSNAYGATASSNATLTVIVNTPGLITFDDLTGSGLPVPAGYNGLTWSNFYYLNGVGYGEPSGFAAAVVSTNNVAYNNDATPAAMLSSAPFNLLSAYLTAAWNDNLRVEAQGYNGPALSYDNSYTLSATNPTLIAFNYLGVTSVRFISSGGAPDPGYGGAGSQFVIDNVTAVPAPTPPPPIPVPMPMTVLHSFNGFDGGLPSSALAQGADGNLYGMTEYGGNFQYGTVFRLTTNGALSTVLSFDNINGAYPQGRLVQGLDGNLYGSTSQGGTLGDGTVFGITTNGDFTVSVSFTGADGAYPNGALALAPDGSLCGATIEGGTSGNGAVFRMTTNGVLTTVLSFNGPNGAYPYGGLITGTDGNLYGTTEFGGTNDSGTVFSVATNGAFSTLAAFNYAVNGGYPSAALVQGADGFFYGTTQFGGTNGDGTVFRVTTNGVLTALFSFANSNGAEPYGALARGADGFFYGTTEYGGTNDGGTVFGITTNGAIASLFSFASTNGLYPQAGLLLGADGCFYGTATFGGVGFNGYYDSGDGIVFRLGPTAAATPPAIITQPAGQSAPASGAPFFSVNAGGAAPLNYSWQRNGSPIAGATQSAYTANNVQLSDSGDQFSCVVGNAYGSAASSNAALTVFSGSGALFSFNGANGGYPAAALIQGADGNFYGTTTYGGTFAQGTLFRLTTNGLLTTLMSFNLTNGAQPNAALAQAADGNFYGTTTGGGTYQHGTVFRMTPNGAVTTLLSFQGPNGAEPYSALAQGADGIFYGTTQDGGTNNSGTVFSVTTNGAFTTLFSFGGANGAGPYGPLLLGADGSFYGTTEDGGTNNFGTVFCITTNGALTPLFSFDYSNGAYPQGALAQGADGTFYGTTTEGGKNGYGTLFSMTTNGALTTLFSFAGSNGFYPQGGLVQGSDGNFYGTTTQGGTYGDGTVFSMATNGTVTSLLSFEGANGSYPASALIQASDGNFYGTTTYGAVGYDGLSSSGNGAVFRLAAPFAPQSPLIVTQPASQSVHPGGAAVFSVTAASSTPLNYFWQRNGANIAGATRSSYFTNDVQPSDSGNVFVCMVSNAYGSIASSNATLTIGPASLVQNGGFELGTFADWTTNGNLAYCSVGSVAAAVHSGLYGAELGPIGSPGYISQTLSTIAGEQYEVTFWLSGGGLSSNEFSVSWNGVTLFDQQNVGGTQWTNLQLYASAASTNTVLTFGFRDDPSYFGLDDIAVYPIGLAPPQIQSLALSGGAISFAWSAAIGQIYQVQFTTNLTPAAWTLLGDPIAATNSTMSISIPIGADSQQFYRLVLQP